MHIGWGIEGAIGSFYKIDCSYLSPNVNLAARIETASNIYNVNLMISDQVYEGLSSKMSTFCREIDRVSLKGSILPITLYTIDINKNIRPGKLVSDKDYMNLKQKRDYYHKKKKLFWSLYYNENKKDMEEGSRYLIKEDKSIGEIYLKKSKGLKDLIHKTRGKIFLKCFEKGLSKYYNGKWNKSKEYFNKAKYLYPDDGPTNTLLEYMTELDFIPPKKWKGVRQLTKKS